MAHGECVKCGRRITQTDRDEMEKYPEQFADDEAEPMCYWCIDDMAERFFECWTQQSGDGNAAGLARQQQEARRLK